MLKNKLDRAKNVVVIGVIFIFMGCSDSSSTSKEEGASSVGKQEQIITYTSESLADEIAKIEIELEKPSVPNKPAIREKLVMFYHDYFKLFFTSSLAPEMLFKAGNESVNLQKYQDALSFYSLAEKNYQEYQKRPECIYLQGFIFDTYTNEYGKAKEKYEYLIKRYPKHVLSEQAQLSLDHLGKTDEDLIREFEKKNSI
ncbi:MAG: tetratricopeptide repeat protein [Salibacteraceae bacterium]